MLKEYKNLISFPSKTSELWVDLDRFSSPLFGNEELKKLLQYFRQKNFTHYLIVKFLLSTGVSIPDLLYFQIKCIDFESGFLTLLGGKRLNFRKIRLEREFLLEIYRYCSDLSKESPLFGGRRGCSRNERSIQKILNSASQFLKKEINIPIIRESLAISFHENGASLAEIQTFLGHRSIKSTKQRISHCYRRIEEMMGHNFTNWKEKAA